MNERQRGAVVHERSRVRVVVCGARFGQVYLQALARSNEFELAGLLAQGSARARACAEFYGVPLVTDPARMPAGVELACVVVRGGLLGGQGVEVAKTLMAQGLHVLQEHPLHHDELAECLRCARRHGVVYRLNSFYVHLDPVRRFLCMARELLRTRKIDYLDAACGFQMAYSLLDILGRTTGRLQPWGFADPAPGMSKGTDPAPPFRCLLGTFAGVPLTLRIQNQLDPADPDNHAHVMHQVTVGSDAGQLMLAATHGPVVWSPRPEFPRTVTAADQPHFDRIEPVTDEPPSSAVFGPATVPGYQTLFGTAWPRGISRALGDLRRAAAAGEDPLREGQYHLTLCRMWQDITARLGPPELLQMTAPNLLTPAELAVVAAAGTREGTG
ncbi:Gfo/Idh/MocA family oxidoreductase [Nocardia sp. NPDC051321]|uniref:Gfo/Idh/MocA family oxidoreductase n=1 Tax=Nocardia sp. NPDC051321 TaxID=3364323 RepID=UPI003794BDF2